MLYMFTVLVTLLLVGALELNHRLAAYKYRTTSTRLILAGMMRPDYEANETARWHG